MIEIRLQNDAYESDVRAMVKAFYPNETLFVVKEETNLPVQKRPEEEITRIISVDTKDKDKDEIKRTIYETLSKELNITLPWGTLTGIRPTKIPYAFLKNGDKANADDDIIKYLKDNYYCSEEKAKLSIEVAKKEIEVLSRVKEGGYSLYVHIPFCPTRCVYCSFASFPEEGYKDRMKPYVEALKKELLYVKESFKDRPLNTIYFGGGTPTSLTEPLLEELCEFVRENFVEKSVDSDILEWTVEAGRPDSINREKLRILKNAGVTRISVNPQTMNDETLIKIGRKHTVEDVQKAFIKAREEGFTNINMDIILGLPDENEDMVRNTLSMITKLLPDSLTIHSLAIKHNANLNLFKERYSGYSLTNSDRMMELSLESARKMGLNPYYLYRQKNMVGSKENIGCASPGKEGIYNILIMEELETICSVGAGAITKIVTTPGQLHKRIENVKDIDNYINRIDEMIERKADYYGA